jgi:hypothetical protein
MRGRYERYGGDEARRWVRRSHTACLICQAVAMLQGWALLLCTPKQASKPSTWRARLGALSEALGHDLICQSIKAGVGPARISALHHCKVCTTTAVAGTASMANRLRLVKARQPTSSRKAICSSSRREEWRPTGEDQHDQSIRVTSADLRGCEDSPHHDEPSRLPGPPYLNRQLLNRSHSQS